MKRLLLFLPLFLASVLLASAQVPAGYSEQSNYNDSFEDFADNVSATNLPLGWGYASTGTPYSGYFSRSTYKNTGMYALYVGNKVSSTVIDYLVTTPLKGQVSISMRAYSASSYYDDKQYLRFYEVSEDAEGNYIVGELVKEVVPTSTTYASYDITDLSDYARLAITGSYTYFDDLKASSALVKENAGLQVTAITGTWSDNNPLYADINGKAVYEGTFKVKNSGNVDLVAGHENYAVRITSQAENQITIPETIVPIQVNLAQGAESEEIPFTLECTMVDVSKDARSAIRVTSELLEYGVTATTSTSYKQTSWFTMKAYAPNLDVRNASGFRMSDYTTDLGLVDLPDAKTKMQLRSIGGSDLVLKEIQSTNPAVAFTTAEGDALEFPLTVPKTVEQDIYMAFTTSGGQSTELTFVYGNTYDDTEYNYVGKAISGVIKDPSLYFEDFTSYLTVPTGWCQPGWINEEGSNWSFNSYAQNTYAVNGLQAESGKMLISPKVTFAEGQSLTVAAQPRTTPASSDCHVKVYYSPDRSTWTLAGYIGYANSDGEATKTSAEDVDPSLVLPWAVTSGSATLNSYCKPYVVNGIPAGDWYIGFTSGYSIVDYIFGGKLAEVDNDIYINSFKVDGGKTMVNYPVTATVTYTNMTVNAAADRTVALYDGETLIEEKTGAELESYASETVVFTFTPHEAGELNLKVVISNTDGSYSVSTLTKNVNIKEESMISEVLVGERTSATGSYTPASLNYCSSRAEWIWDAEHLALDADADINSVTFYYYSTTNDLAGKKVSIYLLNTDETLVDNKITDLSSLTPVYQNEDYTFVKAGSSSEHAPLTFIFDTPFTYTGGNIHAIMVTEDLASASYAQYYFEYYNATYGSANYARADNYSAFMSKTSADKSTNVPVVSLGLAVVAPELTGAVTDAETNAPVAGAVVCIKSGDVVYTATTDADGQYTISVLQPTLDYTLTVTAEGYLNYTYADEVSLAGGNQTLNLEITPELPTGISSHNAVADDYAAVYNLAGQRVSPSHKGMVIINGRKRIIR